MQLFYTEYCILLNEFTKFLKFIQGKFNIINSVQYLMNKNIYRYLFLNLDKFHPNFCPNDNRINRISDGILGILIIQMFCLSTFYSVYFMYDPQGIIFIGALIPKNIFIVPLAILSFLFHSYVGSILCINAALLAGKCTVYIVYIHLLLNKELRLGRCCYKTCDNLREAKNIRLVYRSLQILHQHCLLYCPFGIYLAIFNFGFIATTVYITFALAGYWKLLSGYARTLLILGDLFVIAYWIFILQVGCLLFDGSKKVLMSWKIHDWGLKEQNKLMSKFCRSCTPILLCYGSSFVVGKLSILRYFRVITRGTIRALLTTR